MGRPTTHVAPADAAFMARLGTWISWPLLLFAGLVAISWIWNVPDPTAILPGFPAVQWTTALCLAALAIEPLASRPEVRLVLLSFVVGVSGVSLAEAVLHHRLEVDRFLFPSAFVTTDPPGSMAPVTAVALLALATAALLMNVRRLLAAQLLLMALALAATTVLLGYLFEAVQLYRLANFADVPRPTAAGVLVLAAAIAARMPDGLLVWAVVGRGPGSMIVRQSVPIVAVGLVAVGFLGLRADHVGIVGDHFAIASMVLIGVVIAVGAIVVAGLRLDVADRRRANAEAWMHEVNRSLQERQESAWAQAERFAKELAGVRQRLEGTIADLEAVLWTVETTAGGPVPVYVSPNVGRVLGVRGTDGETMAMALARAMGADQSESAVNFRRSVRDGVAAEAELQVTVDGRTTWVRVRGEPRSEGDRRYYDGIMTDITERHDLNEREERLRSQEHLHVERTTQLDKARDEFVAVAGHELRTPVAVILGYLELLTDPDTPEQSKLESIEVITRRSRDLSDLVEQVFDLARLNSGALSLDRRAVPLTTFVEGLAERYQAAADEAHVRLDAQAGPGSVLADEHRLGQVFDTVLTNAIRHTQEGGVVHLTASAQPGQVVVEVADDGTTVDDLQLASMFDQLSPDDAVQNARLAETGLGFSLARAVVEAHAGTIAVRRNIPEGLVFTVTLPASD
jgi:PAS domain S-box-containing protein